MGALGVCLKVCGWFPVVFITAVVLWSYYAYVVELCISVVSDNIPLMLLYLVLYHAFLLMFLWVYWKTIWTPVAKVPSEFYLTSSELQQYEAEDRNEEKVEILKGLVRDKRLPIWTRTHGGGMRYCHLCKLIKPDRCHHCSVCNTCNLKMDHHCPWVNNCVCYSNYKFFVLFLFYTILYCFYVAVTVLPFFIQFWQNILQPNVSGFNIMFLFIISFVFCLSVTVLSVVHVRLVAKNWSTLGRGRGCNTKLRLCRGELGDRSARQFQIVFLFFAAVMFCLSVFTLLCMHTHLTLTNRSTLESFRAPVFRHGPDKEGFSRGSFCNNFKEVFGDQKRYWLLPIFTSKGDGVSYPVQARDQDSDRLLDGEVESDIGSGLETEDREAGKKGIRESIKSSTTYSTMEPGGVGEGGTGDHVALQMDQKEGAQVNLAIESDSRADNTP